MLHFRFSDFDLECGTDEAGRGCLAGPVTAAAIILPEGFELDLLNDSKQLTEKTRERLKPLIEEKVVEFSVVATVCGVRLFALISAMKTLTSEPCCGNNLGPVEFG